MAGRAVSNPLTCRWSSRGAARGGGNPNRIGGSVRYPDMAAMDVAQDRMTKDIKHQQIVAKGADFLISGATRDSLWRSV